jgi:hypothetical protein
MIDLEIQTQELKSTAVLLRSRVLKAYKERGLKIEAQGIPELLAVIAEDMSTKRINKKRLESHALGIFRMITDGWIFEDTDLGQELMRFRLDLRKFASMLPDISVQQSHDNIEDR